MANFKQYRDPADVLYTFYIKKDLKQKLDEYAKNNNTRTARVLREVIGKFVRKEKDGR